MVAFRRTVISKTSPIKWFMELWQYVLACVLGALCGVFGGMGMGGGTLLIPALTAFFDIEQKIAQSINLISFLPMSAVALFIHLKNKRIDFKNVLYMIIPAVIFSAGGSILATIIKNDLLKKFFGVFLILLALFNAYMTVKSKNDDKDPVNDKDDALNNDSSTISDKNKPES